ncbi:CDP-glycerol glycerophosphotransferase family protein [Pedobacter sp.]|uniref:CDP-glycerol glycerophosphotransferase family protein n=1 Tax=Pedobacter sp. TaxID=1411316 RepID=UPI003D7F274C
MHLTKLRQIVRRIFHGLNQLLPKTRRAIIVGFPNAESSAIAVANHIYEKYKVPVYYATSYKANDFPEGLLFPGIKVIQRNGTYFNYLLFHYRYMRSKYLFFTHGGVFDSFPATQIATNIWHGVLYKNVGLLDGRTGVKADVTVGTSELTRDMFSRAFGVPAESVYLSGYPRNDLLIKANQNKKAVRQRIDPMFSKYDKVIIWMPTYRKRTFIYDREDGKETGNPFYIEDFNLLYFNELLRKNNCLCIVKPHPMAIKYSNSSPSENLLFIDDAWISQHHITLYDLVGASDILLSDVSSVMIDYLLIDQPILCISTDFEAYKNSRGFYFEDIEQWLPGPVLDDQYEFFKQLSDLLTGLEDPYAAKRKLLKAAFFSSADAHSTERLVSHVFKLKK